METQQANNIKKISVMKHIKLFEQFINESYLNGTTVKSKVYHVSRVEIKRFENKPLWFALEKEHSTDGWYNNTIEDRGEAFQYEAKIKGKIGTLDNPEIVEIFNKLGTDPMDWETDLLQNPTPEEVLATQETKALIEAGWDGIIYYDYDPRDWNSDLEALIVFDPTKSVKGWKLIKRYPQ